MSRKLASIQTVKAIRPIEGADRIEVVQVLNWDCVAPKDQYKVGDKVIYFEIDSLLPDIPIFEFLKGSSWSQKLNKYKIKTHKMRGQISQGLVIPISDFPKILEQLLAPGTKVDAVGLEYLAEGTDLTEVLMIEKYEPPVSNGSLGETINHEWYVPKTDEERIQVCAEDVLPEYMNNDDWYASIKLDGTSCTAGYFEDGYFIAGRNQWFKGPNMYTETVDKYDLSKKVEDYQKATGIYIVFQGELCGPGIQSNRLGLTEKDWFIFNVFTSDTGKYGSYTKCNYQEMLEICEYFGLTTVPIINMKNMPVISPHISIDNNVENLLKYVDTLKYRTYFEDASPSQIAEGIVIRRKDMSNSFKVVSNKYLLKGGE